MMANMTYPFSEAEEWNRLAPKTLKQILVRSTNVLGYKPQPRNIMRITGEMVCEQFHVIRSFDFLNHIENMKPFAEVVLHHPGAVFQPAISLSQAEGFDVPHYLGVTEAILEQTAKILGNSSREACRHIILALKDMAGVCSPAFITALVSEIRKRWPELIIQYHRHCTDGLFIPAVAAAAKAGAHILDTSIGAAVRWYGQGDVIATSAYLENELGIKTNLNQTVLREANFVLKQIMPYYDRYVSPYFQGVDYDVVKHGMPGGATSTSQEGAMKQGYIRLLPYMLHFLACARKIVRYHDVTPGSQITWNTAFLAVTGAFKRGGEQEVQALLDVLDEVTSRPEEELSLEVKRNRLGIYRDCNDAFRDLLLGKFGKLPLGFPANWVYESAFGSKWQKAIEARREDSPLDMLDDVDLDAERAALTEIIKREPTEEEFVLYLNHPGDAVKVINLKSNYGDPNHLPLHIWFEGMQPGDEAEFFDSSGKPHQIALLSISPVDDSGACMVRYVLDSSIIATEVQVSDPVRQTGKGASRANPDNLYEVGAPSSGDLWIMHAEVGKIVRKGEELFNISIMKQEKSVLAPVDGVVLRVLKTADYTHNKEMVPVREGELLVELGPVPKTCPFAACGKPIPMEDMVFCPYCGGDLSAT